MFMTCLAATMGRYSVCGCSWFFLDPLRDIELVIDDNWREFARLYSAPIVESPLEDMSLFELIPASSKWIQCVVSSGIGCASGLKIDTPSSGTTALRREIADNSQVEELLQKAKTKIHRQMGWQTYAIWRSHQGENGSIGIKPDSGWAKSKASWGSTEGDFMARRWKKEQVLLQLVLAVHRIIIRQSYVILSYPSRCDAISSSSSWAKPLSFKLPFAFRPIFNKATGLSSPWLFP